MPSTLRCEPKRLSIKLRFQTSGRPDTCGWGLRMFPWLFQYLLTVGELCLLILVFIHYWKTLHSYWLISIKELSLLLSDFAFQVS